MIVREHNLSMIRGDSESITVSITDGFQSGDIIEMTVRKAACDPKKYLYKKITQFSDGKAVIAILPSDTESIPFGSYYYDIQLTRGNGDVITIIKPAKFTLLEEITYG